ncbi:MAG: exodeoxyribonuclease III [Holosporales bacterium]|jgi:exodeoxyribonuclease-3|nr:exodeoxyribonuclease III [Holosporales bacterium]
MRIATWNVNSIRVRFEQTVEFLRSNEIDIILLQELKCANDIFPYEPFEDIGYNCSVYGQKTYNGVAILSKHLIEDVKLGNKIFTDDSQARYIEAFINGYRLASVYVPNGGGSIEAFNYKLEFMDKLSSYLKEAVKQDGFIIGGDFNVARDDLDVYDPEFWKGKVCCTDEERLAFTALLDIGFTDRLREISGDKKIYSWWDYRRNGFSKNRGLRLDYILTTENVNVKNCRVDLKPRSNTRASDHAPVVMEII